MTDPTPVASASNLPPLAQPADVLIALGVGGSDVTVLPNYMQVRMDRALARVSRRFRYEAQRWFTPGVYTHLFRIHAGTIRLMEPPNIISTVSVRGLRRLDWQSWLEGGDQWVAWEAGYPDNFVNSPPPPEHRPWPQLEVDGIWVRFSDWNYWQLNGKDVQVTYGWNTPIPQDVISAVAEIAGRMLQVDPMSAINQSTQLQSRHFHQQLAPWVSDGTTGFTKDDIEQARAYRYPVPPAIVAQMGGFDFGPSVAFLSDSSW